MKRLLRSEERDGGSDALHAAFSSPFATISTSK